MSSDTNDLGNEKRGRALGLRGRREIHTGHTRRKEVKNTSNFKMRGRGEDSRPYSIPHTC